MVGDASEFAAFWLH